MNHQRTSKTPEDTICVIGFPSKLGGADTELDHQITCWLNMGIEVHLIHTGHFDKNVMLMKQYVEDKGCIVHAPRDWAKCRGMHVISYCNGGFLRNLKTIKSYCKTATFVGCMTWAFEKEISAHREGLIDLELFQTEHQYNRISPKLAKVRPNFRWAYTIPYWDDSDFPFKDHDNLKSGSFSFGRISREDAQKFSKYQFKIYKIFNSPLPKKGTVLGFSPRIQRKVGVPPSWLRVLRAGSISQQNFYNSSSCVIQSSDTFENLPRVGFESMSSGSVLVVDDRGGWKNLVSHGTTGFLCKNQRDFVHFSSLLANDHQLRRNLSFNARDSLNTNWSFESSKRSWENIFDILNSI